MKRQADPKPIEIKGETLAGFNTFADKVPTSVFGEYSFCTGISVTTVTWEMV